MKKAVEKVLEISIAVAIFSVVGFLGSLEANYLSLKQATIYSAIAIIYIGVASIIYICLGQAEEKS